MCEGPTSSLQVHVRCRVGGDLGQGGAAHSFTHLTLAVDTRAAMPHQNPSFQDLQGLLSVPFTGRFCP